MPENARRLLLQLSPLRVLLYLGAILLAVLVVCEASGWPFLRLPLQQQLTTRLQRDVRLGEGFRLHLLGGLRLRVDRIAIGTTDWEKAQSGQAFFITARNARISIPYGSLLGRTGGDAFRIREIDVGRVEARLVRQRDGRSNWRFDRPRQKDEAAAPSVQPEVQHLVVREGRVYLDDALTRLRLEALVRTDESRNRQGDGLRVSASGRYRDQPFSASARSPGLLPLVAPRGNTRPVDLVFDLQLADPDRQDSTLHVEGRARDLLRFDGLEGRFRLKGPSLAAVGSPLGLTLPSTGPFRMHGAVTRNDKVWEVGVYAFEVARTRLAGEFRYDPRGRRPLLTGRLQGRQLVLEDLAPAFGASPAQADSPRNARLSARTRLLPQREFDIPSLHRMDADVEVRLTRLDLGSERLKPLEPLEGQLSLADGVLRLENLRARTADGELTGAIRLDAGPDPPRWKADLAWSGIRLGQWITARNRFADASERIAVGRAGRTAPPPFITGELAGKAVVGGSGRSTAQLLGSLEGSVMVWVRNGELSQLLVEAMGLDVAQGLGLVISGDANIPMHCAALSLKASQGLLRTEAGLVDTPDSLILVRGDISLASERLNLTLEARPHDRSPLSVRAPLHVRGTFSDPSARPDLKQVGGKAVVAALLGALLAPFAALVPLIDPGTSAEGKGCAHTLARLERNPATPSGMKRALRGQ